MPQSKEPIWIRNYEINAYLVNPQRRLGLVSLLNLAQDIAGSHATHLGHGYEEMVKSGLFWALTRQSLFMDSWPAWGETLEIRTWVRPIQSVLAQRDFEFFVGGKRIGSCATSWLTVEVATRKAKLVDLRDYETAFRSDYRLDYTAPKIVLKADLKSVARFKVRNSDLDMNEHVNNTGYSRWVLDSVPLDFHERYQVSRYEANFIAETMLDDEITIESESIQEGSWAQFQGKRESDGKVVFSARLTASVAIP